MLLSSVVARATLQDSSRELRMLYLEMQKLLQSIQASKQKYESPFFSFKTPTETLKQI